MGQNLTSRAINSSNCEEDAGLIVGAFPLQRITCLAGSLRCCWPHVPAGAGTGQLSPKVPRTWQWHLGKRQSAAAEKGAEDFRGKKSSSSIREFWIPKCSSPPQKYESRDQWINV